LYFKPKVLRDIHVELAINRYKVGNDQMRWGILKIQTGPHFQGER
jgi:hypothetical protein